MTKKAKDARAGVMPTFLRSDWAQESTGIGDGG